MRSAATVFFSILAIVFLYFTIVLIESGNVGVRKTLGKVNPEEVTPGLNFRLPAGHPDYRVRWQGDRNRSHRPDTQGGRQPLAA